MENISRKIKYALNNKKITQKELAKKIDVTQATLSRNLNEIHSMRADILAKIAEELNLSVDYLLGLKNENKKNKKHSFKSAHQNTQIFKMIINIIDKLDYKQLNQIYGVLKAVVGDEVIDDEVKGIS